MSDLKRDRVNRVTGMVYLPIDGSRLVRGRRYTLKDVTEEPIDCEIRDPMAMKNPVDGNAVGDAVMDASLVDDPETGNACDANEIV